MSRQNKRIYPNLTRSEAQTLLRCAEQTIGQPHILLELFPNRDLRARAKRSVRRVREALAAANDA